MFGRWHYIRKKVTLKQERKKYKENNSVFQRDIPGYYWYRFFGDFGENLTKINHSSIHSLICYYFSLIRRKSNAVANLNIDWKFYILSFKRLFRWYTLSNYKQPGIASITKIWIPHGKTRELCRAYVSCYFLRIIYNFYCFIDSRTNQWRSKIAADYISKFV